MQKKPVKIPGLWLLDPAGAVKVNPENIVYCHHFRDLTRLVYDNGSRITVQVPLKKIEEKLRPNNFFRCHRNYLVNLRYARRGLLGDDFIKFPGRYNVPVARRKKTQLLVLIDRLPSGHDVYA
jgi:DNA-binding LytR/AlgR family response regulator